MSYPADHKQRTERAYDVSAEMYDKAVGKSMAARTNLLLRDVQIPEGPAVLDVGCGTGISTFELMKRVQGKGRFYGIDISQRMIDLAIIRAKDLGYSNVDFGKGDAERLEFPESSFDLVISNLAFHWVQNKEKSLKEMFRVLRTGGQVALLFNGELHFKEAVEIYDAVRKRHPEYAFPESSWLKALSLEETHELFEKAGFRKPRIFAIHEINHVDPSMFLLARDATTSYWQVGLEPEVVDKLKTKMLEEATKSKTDKGWKVTSYNIIAYAQKT